MIDILNDIVSDKWGHNIVNDSFAHKPDDLLLVVCIVNLSFRNVKLALGMRVRCGIYIVLLLTSPVNGS